MEGLSCEILFLINDNCIIRKLVIFFFFFVLLIKKVHPHVLMVTQNILYYQKLVNTVPIIPKKEHHLTTFNDVPRVCLILFANKLVF